MTVSQLPEPGVILDLDLEQRPPEDVKPPFVIKVHDKLITFADPAELDWQALAAVNIPADLIRVSLSTEDRDHITSKPLPSWKFNKIMESYYTHYDLEAKILAAKRRAQFSV